MKLEFKKGSKYSRKDIGWVCFPDKGRPAGGDKDKYYRRELKVITNLYTL